MAPIPDDRPVTDPTPSQSDTIAAHQRDRLTGWLLLIAAPLLASGLLMPAISVTSLAMFTTTYSLFGGVIAMWEDGKYGLFVLVFVFTVLLPVAKVAIGLWIWSLGNGNGGLAGQLLRLLSLISRWSMLDVFMIALVVLVLEGSLLTTADLGIGVLLFAISVVLSTIALKRLAASRLKN